MNSQIIQLSSERITKQEHITFLDLTEDACLKSHSDYAGCEYQYEGVINEIATELRPVAFINKAKRTLTFKQPGTVRKIYLRNLLQVYRTTKRDLTGPTSTDQANPSVRPSHRTVQNGIETVGLTDYLYFYGPVGGCITLSELLLDYLNGHIPRTIRIGAILNYHYKPEKK